MSNPMTPSAFSASTRPVAAWIPGAASTTGSTPRSGRQKIYNFNNLNQQDTAQLIQRINRGDQMKRSASASKRS
ncbi:hypothetical protein JMUB6875_23720 [Nocardia sp. JMUB6875]